MNSKKQKEDRMVRNSLVLVLQLGLSMVVPIMFCVFICYFIAQTVGNSYITIFGILIGIAAGINGVYRQVKVYLKNEESPGQKARRLDEAKANDNKMDETP